MSRLRVHVLGPVECEIEAPPLPRLARPDDAEREPVVCPCRVLARRLDWTISGGGALMVCGLLVVLVGVLRLSIG
jgi:hypothetical protein